MKNFLKGLAIAGFVVGFIGCGGKAPTPPSKKALLVLKTEDSEFFQSIKVAFLDEMQKLSPGVQVTVRAGSSPSDVNGQREILTEMVGQGRSGGPQALDGLAITPSGSHDELVPQLRGLSDRAIPVVLIDTRIDEKSLMDGGAKVAAFIGSSNKEGGRLAAQEVATKFPDGAKVLFLGGVVGQETAEARKLGFVEAISSLPNAKSYKITERSADWRRSDAREVAVSFFSFGNSFDAVFAANDEMALGVVEAARQFKRLTPQIVIGFDAIDEARQAVKDGSLFATIAQNPSEMGRAAARSLVNSWSGKPVEKEQLLPVVLIKK